MTQLTPREIVRELNRYIKALINGDDLLSQVVSEARSPISRHIPADICILR